MTETINGLTRQGRWSELLGHIRNDLEHGYEIDIKFYVRQYPEFENDLLAMQSRNWN